MPKIIENVRENLILEGRKTLIEKNYKELNIREISKISGIAIGTFYNYFSNKEEFVSHIFKDDWKNTLDLSDKLKISNQPLKEKVELIYLSMQNFIDKYLSIFYEISMIKGYPSEREHDMKDLYKRLEEIIDIEKGKGTINSSMTSEKLSHFILSNLVYLSKNKYVSFDELYKQMGL
jgi:AcrR family transcriptional regulator